jgi:hypothetical protein
MSSDQEAERATTALNGTDFEGETSSSAKRDLSSSERRDRWVEEAGRRAAIATKSALQHFL